MQAPKTEKSIKIVQFSRSPKCFSYKSTSYIYSSLIFAVIPSVLWGMYVFGYRTLLVAAVPIGAALIIEYLVATVSESYKPMYLHAAWVGLLIAAFMPPGVSLIIPFSAAVFARVVVQLSFGGITNCWMNPVAAALVFISVSFPHGHKAGWIMPEFRFFANSARPVVEHLHEAAVEVSVMDGWLTDVMNSILGQLSIILPAGLFDPLLGVIPGTIGGVSVILLLAGATIVFGRHVINRTVSLLAFIVFFVLTYIFGGDGGQLFTGNALYYVSRNSFVLGLFFLATDITSLPFRSVSIVIYAVMIGVSLFLFRDLFPSGVATAVLLVNVLCQLSVRAPIELHKLDRKRKQKNIHEKA